MYKYIVATLLAAKRYEGEKITLFPFLYVPRML